MLDNFLQRIRWSNVMRRLCAAAAVKGKARIDLMIYRIMEMVGDFFFVYADALFDMWRCISCLYFILNVCYSHTKETIGTTYIIKTTLEIIFEEYLLFACFWMDRIRRDHVASVKHPIRFGFDGLYMRLLREYIFFYRLPKAKHLIFFVHVHLLREQKTPNQ